MEKASGERGDGLEPGSDQPLVYVHWKKNRKIRCCGREAKEPAPFYALSILQSLATALWSTSAPSLTDKDASLIHSVQFMCSVDVEWPHRPGGT